MNWLERLLAHRFATKIALAQLEQRIRSVEIAITRVPKDPEKKKTYAEINAEIMAKLESVPLTDEEIAEWRAGM